MSTLFHSARKLDSDGQVDDFWMLVEEDAITATGAGRARDMPPATESIDVSGNWLVPGFIDLHGHGGGGHSYDDSAEEILAGIATHRSHGTTRSIVSLVANPVAQLRASLAVVADLAEADPTILGSHLEGPFLAESKRGAHNPAYLKAPLPFEVEELVGAARGTLRLLTIAPELPGALDAIDVLVDAGTRVGIGHTDADFDLAKEAFDRGARILTHAFNAMNGIHHRAPGPIVAAFEDERVTIELILDLQHVHPDVAGMAFRAAPGRIALVTDAMAAAGSSDGDYPLGTLNVTVRDGLAVLRGTQTIAGSTLTQDAALRNAITHAAVHPVEAIASLTTVPARALGRDHELGRLAPGYSADAVILDTGLHVDRVWANGALVG